MEANFAQMKDPDRYKLAQNLGTTRAFIQYYWEMLPKFRNQKDCFEYLNTMHNKIFGEYKYSEYSSFRVVKNYHLKKKK